MNRSLRSYTDTTRVRFGDVVLNSTAVSKDPASEGFTRYIIGKHIDETKPRVEAWGTVGDSDFGPRIRTMFLPGDIICTTRGPKLKVATVDFRGLGAHTNFVLRTRNPEVLLQSYLEAVVRSESFQQHLAKHFRGSVNLFVNWSDAALYEFDLPSVEEQQRQASLFLATQAFQEASDRSACAARQIRYSLAQLNEEPSSVEYPCLTVADLVETMQYGVSCRPQQQGDIPLLRMGNLRDGVVDTKDLRYTDESAISCDRDLLNRGDVLFNRTNSIELVGKAALFDLEGRWAFASYLVRLVARRSVVLPEFLVAVINSAPVRSRILSAATKGVSQANVNTKNLSKVKVKVPPLSVQERVVDALRELRRTEDMLSARAKGVPAVGLLWGQSQP